MDRFNAYRLTWLLLPAVLLLMAVSCSKTAVGGSARHIPCIEWGADLETVKEYMSAYVLVSEGPDFLYYKGKGQEKSISYHFIDGQLCASLNMYLEDSVDKSYLESMWGGYECLGELDGASIYVNEGLNAIAAVEPVVSGSERYYAVGWTRKNME